MEQFLRRQSARKASNTVILVFWTNNKINFELPGTVKHGYVDYREIVPDHQCPHINFFKMDKTKISDDFYDFINFIFVMFKHYSDNGIFVYDKILQNSIQVSQCFDYRFVKLENLRDFLDQDN